AGGKTKPVKGFFETILIKNGKPQHLENHWRRLKKGMEYYGVKPVLPGEGEINRFIQLNMAVDARLRLSVAVTGPGENDTDTLMELFPYPIIHEPVELMVSGEPFEPGEIVNYGIKPLDYENYRQATARAQDNGYWDTILVDGDSHILETGRANIYIYLDQWYTPDTGCVRGTVREMLISNGLVVPKSLTLRDLRQAKAVGVSNALTGILQVTAVFEPGSDVPIWRYDQKRFHDYLKSAAITGTAPEFMS
ncbi:MAG: aminotransferase class IV, partial [bacterium]|nr:aminotransferase class IV [bacterium]